MTMTDPKEESAENDEGPSATDLVIRDGFPALRIPGTNWKPKIEGEDPIPRHVFWTMENAIHFESSLLPTLLEDCKTVFTARDKPDGAAYSAGQTYFLPANMAPRCALEGLAQSIFLKHTEHLEKGSYNPAQSGANWWTLVLNVDDDANEKHDKGNPSDAPGDDEVGLHFDADYELEEQTTNLLLHPRVATVTYLSNYGAPTLILDQKSPPMDDVKKETLEKGIHRGWLSHPRLGKHTAFDGRLLHGAPGLYFPSQKYKEEESEEDEKRASKRAKIEKKRYTLLVNVWLNHWVMDAGLLDDEVCAKLITPWQVTDADKKSDADFTSPFRWNDVDFSKAPTSLKPVKLAPAVDGKGEPAGEDELALCNHTVTIKYNATMEDCHQAAAAASTVELSFETDAITLHVGEELPDASDNEEEE